MFNIHNFHDSVSGAIINLLAKAHKDANDDASVAMSWALREWGTIEREAGTVGLDYAAIISYDDDEWLVTNSNAYTICQCTHDLSYAEICDAFGNIVAPPIESITVVEQVSNPQGDATDAAEQLAADLENVR